MSIGHVIGSLKSLFTEDSNYKPGFRYRSAVVRSLGYEGKTVYIFIPEISRDGRVPEVFLPRGCILPKRVQVIDDHCAHPTSKILGFVENKRVEGDGVLLFGIFSSPSPDRINQDGVSIGYEANDIQRVCKGSKAVIGGRTWLGPVNVITSWILREVSCGTVSSK